MSNRGLRPCPFCGGEAEIKYIVPLATTVSCTKCRATSAAIPASLQYCADDEVAKSWNRRTNKGTEWIPVAERMPPDDTDVLLCRGEERIVGRWFTEDKEDGPYWISNADFDEWHMNASELPTHWQPLPAPPTHEKKSTDLEVASE